MIDATDPRVRSVILREIAQAVHAASGLCADRSRTMAGRGYDAALATLTDHGAPDDDPTPQDDLGT